MAERPPNGTGPEAGSAPQAGEDPGAEPAERSSRGRIVIRSSSHPPEAPLTHPPLDARDHSGARALPLPADPAEGEEARSKKATPAERPRRRREVQARALERARMDTPAARPRSRRRASDPALLGNDAQAAEPPMPGASAGAPPPPVGAAPNVPQAPLAPDARARAIVPEPASGVQPARRPRRGVAIVVGAALLAIGVLWLLWRG